MWAAQEIMFAAPTRSHEARMMFKEIVDHLYSSFQDTNCAMLDAEEEEVVSVP